MTTAINIRKIVTAGFFLSIFASSCSKNLSNCTGKCDLITFSGNVSDYASSQPISGQTIKVILKKTSCMICSTINVAEGISDAGGQFEFKKEIDTSLLQDHYISVQLTTSESYITRIAPADSSLGYLYPRSKELYFTNIDSSLASIQFKIFTKTSLHINLHRNTAIISGREFISLQYGFFGGEDIGEAFEMSESNKDTTISVNSAVNVFTKISSGKFITYDSLVNKTDSIKCSTIPGNSIDISY